MPPISQGSGQSLPFLPQWRRTGLTTLEMMLVLGVLAILMILLFPVLASARKKSETAICASRLRQTGIGILLYAGEHNAVLPGPWATGNYFPIYRTSASDAPSSQPYQFIWPYVNLPPAMSGKNLVRIGVCPRADRKPTSWLVNSKFFSQGAHWLGLEYPYVNQYPTYPDWNQLPEEKSKDAPLAAGKTRNYPFGATYNQTLPWSIHDVPEPSRLALIRELAGNLNNAASFHSSALPPDYSAHCNYLFLDGRVESLAQHQKPREKK